jgi:hypothetical protein
MHAATATGSRPEALRGAHRRETRFNLRQREFMAVARWLKQVVLERSIAAQSVEHTYKFLDQSSHDSDVRAPSIVD